MARARSLPSVLAVAPLLLLGCGERPSGDATSGTPATQQPARHTLAVPEPQATGTYSLALIAQPDDAQHEGGKLNAVWEIDAQGPTPTDDDAAALRGARA